MSAKAPKTPNEREAAAGASDDQNPPNLTTTGEPHPLTEGGYDPNADPQRRPEESDVAGLKAGHTTQQQADALAQSDLAHQDDPENLPHPPSTMPETKDAGDHDKDPGKGHGHGHGHGHGKK